MKTNSTLIDTSSPKCLLALVKADLIPHLINTLKPLSLSLSDAVDIHIYLMKSIPDSLRLATPFYLEELGIKDGKRQQAVHETVLKQVLAPSEKYSWHLCVNRYSIINGDQSMNFLELLALLLRISPYYRPTMDVVHSLPVFLTIPSCLTYFVNDRSMWSFLYDMIHSQKVWNRKRGEVEEIGKIVNRKLRMEGIEDVIEEMLQNDQNGSMEWRIVAKSIGWNNLQGMNLSEPE
ncbi:hypothetical protein BLNAU_1198 [Blattamonas nauphoetae]|uniref:Uncharacterized protein n=1 Tax=Blattamonas nauphoetae TaxID=2049346 RepID=A0ABQ9YIP5_9EUKA|nr:hypothetical protein BLNAU_1198 [Blattamonas nauphoetae]